MSFKNYKVGTDLDKLSRQLRGFTWKFQRYSCGFQARAV